MRQPAGWRLLLLSLFLLGGCSIAPQTEQLLTASTPTLPERQEITTTPFFPQTQYHCGPAALATLMTHLEQPVTPQQLAPQVYVPKRQGSLQTEMLASARSFDLIPYLIEPRLETLFEQVAQGRPVLVLQNLGLESLPRWHYAVVIGYDLHSEEVILRSGVTRRLVRPMRLFEHTWRRSGYWAFTLLKPETDPNGLQQQRYLQASATLEQIGRLQSALTAYTSATNVWPNSPIAWMARGNAAYQLQQYAHAEQAYRQALDRDPALAAGWNNLAYSLQARRCPEQARQAVACAIQLAPENDTFRDSLRELSAQTDSEPPAGPGNQCHPIACPR